MNFQNLLTKTENGIFTITINRPDKLNALNKKTVQEIGEAMTYAISTDEVKAIIITGAGNKSFVAGADIAEFIGLSPEEGSAMADTGQAIFDVIENSPKPVVAAVNGFALGGGCELSMACHIRVAADNAKFGQPEVNLGIIPGYGGTQRLIQCIGKSKAFEFLMTADMLGAEEAHRLGLVNHVTTQEQLLPKCLEIIEKIKSKSPAAISGIIKCVNAYFTNDVNGFETEIEEFGNCFTTEDCKEGTTAFLEKRKANFTGR